MLLRLLCVRVCMCVIVLVLVRLLLCPFPCLLSPASLLFSLVLLCSASFSFNPFRPLPLPVLLSSSALSLSSSLGGGRKNTCSPRAEAEPLRRKVRVLLRCSEIVLNSSATCRPTVWNLGWQARRTAPCALFPKYKLGLGLLLVGTCFSPRRH